VDALLGLNAYDWLVFTSCGERSDGIFRHLFPAVPGYMRDIGGVRIAAVARPRRPKLRRAASAGGFDAGMKFTGKKIAAAFAKFQTIENLKMCLLRAEVAKPRFAESAGRVLAPLWTTSRSIKPWPETEDPAGAGATLLESGADWITFTSGSTVEHFHGAF